MRTIKVEFQVQVLGGLSIEMQEVFHERTLKSWLRTD